MSTSSKCRKPPWFVRQSAGGPVPLASFEEDLFDTASESAISSPESEQNSVPPLPVTKQIGHDVVDVYEDSESQEGTLTPKSSTAHSKDGSLMSSRDELSVEESAVVSLSSPKTPSAEGRSISPFSSLFKWRSSSPHRSPKKQRSKSGGNQSTESLESPLSPCPKSPKSPRWKLEGKSFLSIFKFGGHAENKSARLQESKKKTSSENDASATNEKIIEKISDSMKTTTDSETAPEEKRLPANQDVVESPVNSLVIVDCSVSCTSLHENSDYVENLVPSSKEDFQSSDADVSAVEDDFPDAIEVVKNERVIDYEAEQLISQDSVEYDEPQTLELLPVVLKSEPATPRRKQRLEVTTIPLDRPRSATPLVVWPLEAFISSCEPNNKESVDKIKLTLPGEEFTKQRSPRKISSKSWIDFCETGLQSPRSRKRCTAGSVYQYEVINTDDGLTSSGVEIDSWIAFDNLSDGEQTFPEANCFGNHPIDRKINGHHAEDDMNEENCFRDIFSSVQSSDHRRSFSCTSCKCSEFSALKATTISSSERDLNADCRCTCHTDATGSCERCDCGTSPSSDIDCSCECHRNGCESVCPCSCHNVASEVKSDSSLVMTCGHCDDLNSRAKCDASQDDVGDDRQSAQLS